LISGFQSKIQLLSDQNDELNLELLELKNSLLKDLASTSPDLSPTNSKNFQDKTDLKISKDNTLLKSQLWDQKLNFSDLQQEIASLTLINDC
jgi:hypothetical protein